MSGSRPSRNFEISLARFLESRREWAQDLLCRLISYRSTTGAEAGVQNFLGGFLQQRGFAPAFAVVPESIASDPDYTVVPLHESYHGRPNIVVRLAGSGGGRAVIINSHTDVVPGADELFKATVENGTIRGRGACDAKGQVVAMILALEALRELGVRLAGDVEAQFVIEEEAGGNGSLALLAAGSRADAAIVFEPTGLAVKPANRGAAWFRLAVSGHSVHMGRYDEGVSALDEMVGLIGILKDYENRLRAESKSCPGFPADPSPVVVNVGKIRGGDWPSTLPAECIAEGGIAFLPNRTARRIESEIQAAIVSKASPWAREHARFELTGIRNEAFETPAGHPAVTAFTEAAEKVLGPRPLEGWVASCDARLFFHRGGMPTIVFGAGDLRHAHAEDERVALDDVLRAAEVLVRFIMDWCGVSARKVGKEG